MSDWIETVNERMAEEGPDGAAKVIFGLAPKDVGLVDSELTGTVYRQAFRQWCAAQDFTGDTGDNATNELEAFSTRLEDASLLAHKLAVSA